MTFKQCGLILSAPILLGLAFASLPTGARADDEQPAGVVEQPDNVTTAPTDEGASERAGAGFDTPYSSQNNEGAADNLQPHPTEAAPNN
jgi:hypothetical protein